MDPLFAIPLMIVLLVLKGFFSGSEIALVNAKPLLARSAAWIFQRVHAITTVSPSSFPLFSRIVNMSRSAWVGCS